MGKYDFDREKRMACTFWLVCLGLLIYGIIG